MSRNFSQQKRIYEILQDYEWHTNEEFNFTHHLTHASQRIGEMLDNEKDWPGLKETLEFGWDGQWRKYRLKRPTPVQTFMPFSHNFN